MKPTTYEVQRTLEGCIASGKKLWLEGEGIASQSLLAKGSKPDILPTPSSFQRELFSPVLSFLFWVTPAPHFWDPASVQCKVEPTELQGAPHKLVTF